MAPRQLGKKVPILRLLYEMIVVGVAFAFLAVAISFLLYFVLEGDLNISGFRSDPEVGEALEIATLFAAPLVLYATLVVGDSLLRKRQVSLRALGLKKPENLGVTIFEGLGLTAILLAFWVASWQFYQTLDLGVPYEIQTIIRGDEFRYFYAMTAFTWIATAFGEEVLFRGFYMNTMLELFRGSGAGVVFAVIFQALIFSLLHMGSTTIQSIPVFITGLIMGGAYFLFNRNLWPLIIAHGLLNNLYFALLYNNIIG